VSLIRRLGRRVLRGKMAKQSQTAITALSANPIKQPPSVPLSLPPSLPPTLPALRCFSPPNFRNVCLRVSYPSSLKLCLSSPRVIVPDTAEYPLPRNIVSKRPQSKTRDGKRLVETRACSEGERGRAARATPMRFPRKSRCTRECIRAEY